MSVDDAGATRRIDPVSDDLERRFTYHQPKADQPERYEIVRTAGHMFAAVVCEKCPPSRELWIAIQKIEEAVFWANAAIARRE